MKALHSIRIGTEVVIMVFGALIATGLGIVAGVGCLALVRATRDRAS